MSAQAFSTHVAQLAPQTGVATSTGTSVGVGVSAAVAIGLGSIALIGGLLSASLGVGIQKLAEMSVTGPSPQVYLTALGV